MFKNKNIRLKNARFVCFLEKTLLWYRSNGYQKERFGAVIDRVGFEVFLSDITDDNLIKHKEDILALDIPQKNNNR